VSVRQLVTEPSTRPRRPSRAGVRSAVRAVACVAAVLIGAIALGMPSAHADSPIPPPPQGSGQFVETWGLAPTGIDPSQPSSRPNLTYSLAPGATQADSVSLWNFSDVQLTFHVYATDAYNNATGAFTLLPGNVPARDAGSWIAISDPYVTVPPNTRADIPISVSVPANATPGDHTAGIVASLPTRTTTGSGQPLTVDRRTGSRVYIRVAGPINPSLVVEHLSSDYHGSFNPLDGKLDVTYTLRNPGNVRLGAHQVVSVHDIFGRTVASKKVTGLAELLPGNSVTEHATFTGVPAAIRLSSHVTVTPVAAQGAGVPAIAAKTWTTSVWAIPWTVLLALVLLVLLWRLYRRYRRSRHGSAPTTAGGNNGGGSRGPGPGPTGGTPRVPEQVLGFRGTDLPPTSGP
jgi:hypothetical protein